MEKKINGISLLRVIAVCMILVVHFGQSLPTPQIVHIPIVWCQHGVQLFFLLSGYLIFKSLDRNSDIKNFYKKRVIRIVPVYWVTVIINIVLFSVILKSMPVDELYLGWGRYFLFLQTLLPASDVNAWNNLSALWTMSAFAVFYLVAPLFFRIMKSYKRACITVASMLGVSTMFTVVLNSIAEKSKWSESLRYLSIKSPIAVLWIFLLGGLIVLMQKENRGGLFLYVIAIWSLIYGYTGVTIVIVWANILDKVSDQTYSFGKIGNTLISQFDEYSFSIYLAHTTCLEFFALLRDRLGLNIVVIAGLSAISTVLLTIVLHNLVEKRFLKLKRGRKNAY